MALPPAHGDVGDRQVLGTLSVSCCELWQIIRRLDRVSTSPSSTLGPQLNQLTQRLADTMEDMLRLEELLKLRSVPHQQHL
ncbi:hypothetical protein SAMN05444920_14710 [Nonomuraea solani]|uniref:Uncharacterized protein n=1 Tax=Nonomuraea solani TaxID=1144553 RepID=A0A1H6F169_9ACTN|nr:hypothetical protein SAMN05444920_14710 [Nonomuraea solani]